MGSETWTGIGPDPETGLTIEQALAIVVAHEAGVGTVTYEAYKAACNVVRTQAVAADAAFNARPEGSDVSS